MLLIDTLINGASWCVHSCVPKSTMPSHSLLAKCPIVVSCITGAVAAGGDGGTTVAAAAQSINANNVANFGGPLKEKKMRP